jgi:antitoxin component of MazEF toxin-antitoxin module
MMAISQGSSKSLFRIAKMGALASATVDAFASFNAALKNPPGPPWTIPVAAAALASGIAQVQAIKSTSFGGGGAAGGGGGGGASAATPTATSATAAQPAEIAGATGGATTGTQVAINLGDDDDIISKRSVRMILDGLNEQIKDGAQLTGISTS